MKVFMISGLGADKRAFTKLKLNCREHISHVEWLAVNPNESLKSYTKRVIDEYAISKDDVVIGLSFGGIISVEIFKQIQNDEIIIISSARNKYDLPRSFRLAGSLGLINLIPSSQLNRSNAILKYIFGTKTKNENELLKDIVSSSEPKFMKWAIGQICNWEETNENLGIVRIHGTKDRLIPYKNKVNYTIDGGGHLMILQRAKEISDVINGELKGLF